MRELSLTNCRLDKRYDVERQLGRGSYAEIFVARDILASPQSPHSQVVIKALNVFLQDDLDADLERTLVENFQNEAIALDRVRHPNIISRLGHGTARDLEGTVFHYLVLEYMAGGDLQRVCREQNLSLADSLKYLEQVCAGLKHAHKNGVIHRDVKPQNLLLTADRETVKIADFGVARIHQTDAPITRVGTNVYAPPEHSPMNSGENGNGAGLTPAADIYSLAKSVYSLLTCESPRHYSGRQVTDLPITVRSERWAIELLPVLRKATTDDPAERHQAVDEFWAELEPIRRISREMESAARPGLPLHQSPQPHVARGYSPLAPQRPAFSTSRDLKLEHPLMAINPAIRIDVGSGPASPYASSSPAERAENHWPNAQPALDDRQTSWTPDPGPAFVPRKKKRFVRRAATLGALLVIFASLLYGTAAYLSGTGVFPTVTNPFADQTGVAKTDINLRPDPSVNNDPIGLVTKNSRVRIVKSQNNWYQVEVIEQGRPRDEQIAASRGWLNRQYIDLE